MFSERFLNKLVRVQYMVGNAANEVNAHIVDEDQNFIYLEENSQCIRLDSVVSVSEVVVKEHANPLSFLKLEKKAEDKKVEPEMSEEEKIRAKAIADAVADFQNKVLPEEHVERDPGQHAQFTLSATISKNFTAIRCEKNIRKEEEQRRKMQEEETKKQAEMEKHAPHTPATVQLSTVSSNNFQVIRSPENIAKEQERARQEELRIQEELRAIERKAEETRKKLEENRRPKTIQLKTFQLSDFMVSKKKPQEEIVPYIEPTVQDVVVANDDQARAAAPEQIVQRFNNVAIGHSIAV